MLRLLRRLPRSWMLFVRPSKARNDWERIDANLDVALGNIMIVGVVVVLALFLHIKGCSDGLLVP